MYDLYKKYLIRKHKIVVKIMLKYIIYMVGNFSPSGANCPLSFKTDWWQLT